MAIVVQCFHCAHVLELDDGFRGGVCRCSQCGALLQVPKDDGKPVERPKRPAAPVPKPGPRKGGSGTDIGISSGRLDPRNAPSGNYRGAADPGFSSGKLHPGNLKKSVDRQPMTPERPVDAPPSLPRTSPLERSREIRRNRWLLFVGWVLGVAVVATAVIVTINMVR